MLYRLEIENFYSIRHLQVIDLRVGEAVPDEPGRFDPVVYGSTERAVRVAAFFGPNASGKSTVLKALTFIGWFVEHSFQAQPTASLPCERFNGVGAAGVPIKLAVEFTGPLDLSVEDVLPTDFQATLRYELELKQQKGRIIVHSESLKQRRAGKGKWTKVFERIGDEVTAGKSFALAGYSMVIDKVRDNASLVATLAQFDHKPSLLLQKAARSIVKNIFLERTDVTDQDAINFYAGNKDMVDALNREIRRIDLGIRKMSIVQGPNGPLAFFEHEGLEQPMPWLLESHGTKNFIKYFPLIETALANGGIAVVDELDVSIHPLVLPEVIKWFHDDERNPHKAQLWLTCHAASLLEDLAKEEVFFCEKNAKGETSVYSLQDIKNVRRTDNRYRKYLSGIYGAVPQIG
ncbi:AAA family ATPase [Pseudorhodoplanes sp.]|uniref:AAA family ATPase n=1 Tax=Pseudorhodoplanes sp. TaxID=1934341 RepID=UPI003D10859E